MDSNFDILDYLNQVYMTKVMPDVNINKVGISEEEKEKEEILENKKRRINIPDAEIKHFSLRSEEDVEEYNEPEDDPDPEEQPNGTGDHETSPKRAQKRGLEKDSGTNVPEIADEVVEI